MAISRLAISNPGAITDTLLYTADRSSLASIIATNKASTVAEVRVWVIPQGQDATPANWSYIAYDADITATNSLETFRFPIMAGDKVYVRSTTADVSFQIMGIYETGADTYVYAQPTQPTAPQIGDIWVDTASDVPSIDNTTVYRWSKTATGGETSLSGTGNDLSILKYIAGYEQVYLNGVLLAKDLDYFATNGTSITGLLALTAGDIVEVISPYAIELTDVYTKSVSDAKYQTKSSSGLNLVIPTGATNGTVSANGAVTIGNGVSSVTVNGAFSATYDNYKIIISGGVCSTETSFNLQLATTGTNYHYAVTYQQYNAPTPLGIGATAGASWVEAGRASASGLSMSVEVFNPFLSLRSGYRSMSTDFAPTSGFHIIGSGILNDTNSYTSFTVKPSSGTITGGKIRIYGYNNGGA